MSALQTAPHPPACCMPPPLEVPEPAAVMIFALAALLAIALRQWRRA